MGWLYFDQYYLLLVVPAMIIALIAQINVKSTYSKMSKVRNIRGITGVQAAQTVLTYYGITDVTIQRCAGTLSDHYNPRNKTLNLSQGVYDSDSIAAVGIACHEVGHAIQHATGYAPIKIRNFLVPICNIGSSLGLPLAIIGYVMGFEPLVSIGLILYSLIAVFQFITLPVEFNASSRAMAAIEERGLLYDDETGKARKVLSAAAMTYVASLIVSLANLLRLVLRFGNRRR
ncbi:MAG: zinc metallopeptidase [Clostridia bacterium]|nr:zinc metallopeptidase [Clostridia bacterium]